MWFTVLNSARTDSVKQIQLVPVVSEPDLSREKSCNALQLALIERSFTLAQAFSTEEISQVNNSAHGAAARLYPPSFMETLQRDNVDSSALIYSVFAALCAFSEWIINNQIALECKLHGLPHPRYRLPANPG
jgi:hypothetical protein